MCGLRTGNGKVLVREAAPVAWGAGVYLLRWGRCGGAIAAHFPFVSSTSIPPRTDLNSGAFRLEGVLFGLALAISNREFFDASY
jgi:hypothetical protein